MALGNGMWTSTHWRDDACGRLYYFPSLRQGFDVCVAVPADWWARSGTEVALRAALAGIRLGGQSMVSIQRRLNPEQKAGA